MNQEGAPVVRKSQAGAAGEMEVLMNPQVQDKMVGTLRRQCVQELRATIRGYRGRRMFDLRYFVQDDVGRWIAAPRGISLPIEQLPELGKVLRRLFQAVKSGKEVRMEHGNGQA